MDMYLSKQLSVPMLIRVLDTLKGLCKKAKCLSLSPGKHIDYNNNCTMQSVIMILWSPKGCCDNTMSSCSVLLFFSFENTGCENSSVQLAFRFSYLPLWEEIMRILSRGGRDVAVASEHQLSELLTAMIDFLHGAREFIRTDGTCMGKILIWLH